MPPSGRQSTAYPWLLLSIGGSGSCRQDPMGGIYIYIYICEPRSSYLSPQCIYIRCVFLRFGTCCKKHETSVIACLLCLPLVNCLVFQQKPLRPLAAVRSCTSHTALSSWLLCTSTGLAQSVQSLPFCLHALSYWSVNLVIRLSSRHWSWDLNSF